MLNLNLGVVTDRFWPLELCNDVFKIIMIIIKSKRSV